MNSPLGEPELSIEKPKLLLVDDEELLRNMYGRSLAREDRVEGTITEDVQEALAAMVASRFAVVISDGLDGGWKTVLNAAMEQDAYPVLFSASQEIVGQGRDLGIDSFDKGHTPFGKLLDKILERF